jgi:S-methylmethionine-dependent homocysteine/selenocysteine methylase
LSGLDVPKGWEERKAMSRSGREIVLLDGGMGQELIRRSKLPLTPLWSARMLLEELELVEDLHCAFIEAGARVITLNSYAATGPRLARDDHADAFLPMQEAALKAARRARDRAGRDVRIAGCLPPLVASYRADVVPSFADCLAEYRRIVEAQAAGVDLFLCETMTLDHEIRAATRAAAESGKPVWAAVTVDDQDAGKARSGQRLLDVAEAALDEGARAVLVNCSTPEATGSAVSLLAGETRVFGAYANGFTSIDALEPGGTVEALQTRRDLGTKDYADHALGWARAGAAIVGGCCEIGPAHIAELARRLSEEGYKITARLDAP